MNQVPVTIITGFLGSGKTTLLNHLLSQPALANSAVIINEFGDIAIDHLLVSTPAENMVLLDTGCLCCTVRGDLIETLTDLHEKRTSGAIPPITHLLIETTGLADPVPVLQTIVADPKLAPVYRLHDVITLVDGVHGERTLDEHAEAVKQAALADALLISKTDLAAAPAVDALRRRLARINPGAEVHEVVHGDIDASTVVRGNVYDPRARAADIERWLRESAYGDHAHDHAEAAAHTHDGQIRAFCVYRENPIRRAGLMMWLDMLSGLLGANLLRVKGVLNVEGDPVVIHAVQSVVHEPVLLNAWPGDDRRSRLVFIARHIDRREIERTFDAFDYSPVQARSKAIDPDVYAQFVQAMKGFRQSGHLEETKK